MSTSPAPTPTAASPQDEDPKNASSTSVKQEVLKSAPPPAHAIAAVTAMVAVFAANLPSWESLQEAATVETLTHRHFPGLVSLHTLACIRMSFAVVIWMTTLYGLLLDWSMVYIPYMPGSKLLRTPFRVQGIQTLFPFTGVAWNLLGAAFTLLAVIAFQVAEKNDEPSPILRVAALVLWEISAPFTLLVSSIVRYVLWPVSLKAAGSSETLRKPRLLLQHNANVIFAVIESALLSGLPVRGSDLPMAPLVGCAYVIFSWNITHLWTDPDKGPQFLYFFLDTTLPGYTTSYALVGLLVVLLVAYGIYMLADQTLAWLIIGGGGEEFFLCGRVLYALVLTSLMVRFRD